MSNQNLKVPFEIPITGGMSPGKMIILQGTIPPSSRSFAVDLLTDSGDIALHINPRFNENRIVRNSVAHMMWGAEESSGSMPINPGHRFELLIECAVADFQIAFNNRHFTEFNHRLPYSRVVNLAVEGDVDIHNINFKDGDEDSYGKSSSAPSQSYGFTPAPKPSNPNSSGGLYPTGSLYPTAPSSEPDYRPNLSGGSVPYPNSNPSLYPKAPSPGLYPSPGGGGAPYPGNPTPQPPPTNPGFHYPNPGAVPPFPNNGPAGGVGSLYPSTPNSGGYYPSPGGGSPYYPSQPGYNNGPHQGSYSNGGQSGGYSPQPNNKPGFLDQAGAALAGVLGPTLLAGGMNRRTNTDGKTAILDQAGRALAGIFGGGGTAGTSHHKKHNKLGILGGTFGTAVAGAALTGHLNPVKAAKKQLKAHKKALKYGIPIASAGLGAYVLHKGLKKSFKRSSSSSSCSSSD